MSKAVKPTFLSEKTICQKKVTYNICLLSSWSIVQSKYKIKAKHIPDMQWTHLQHCQAPFPSWCPGSTPAQVPCAWRPSKMVRMSCLVFYLFILSFQLNFSINLSDCQPGRLSCCQPGWPPWWRAPLGLCRQAAHQVKRSQRWISLQAFAFHQAINHVGWKGNLLLERKLKFVETNFLQNPNFSHLGAFKSHDHNAD